MLERVGVVGSRGYQPLEEVEDFVASLPPGVVVVSGTEPGADPRGDRVDERAIRTARRLGHPTVVHPAEWAERGKSAGPYRNSLLVADVDRLVAFWDGSSRGTADTIEKARAKGVDITIFRPTVPLSRGPMPPSGERASRGPHREA